MAFCNALPATPRHRESSGLKRKHCCFGKTYDMRMSLLFEAAEKTIEGMGVFLKLPEKLAKDFPALESDGSPPHVTVLYIGNVDAARKDDVIETIEKVCSTYEPMEVWVGGLAYFENPKGEQIAHSMVEAKGLAGLSRDIWDAVMRLGVKVEHSFPDYTPHVTLQYGTKRDYKGETPEGNFKCTELEIWIKDGEKLCAAKLGKA